MSKLLNFYVDKGDDGRSDISMNSPRVDLTTMNLKKEILIILEDIM
jgi:hypothetical protein